MVRELGRRKTDLGVGSNAWGLGGDATDNGKGAVLGNPHFPWAGSERFYQSHVTVPGQLDVSGGTLYGVPAVLIGHTKGLAWSHTVATAWRLTPFELKLVPGDPLQLLPGRRPTKMKATKLTVKVKVPGQNLLQDRTRTLYETVHGPMFTSLLGLPLFPWTPATGYAMGDVNADNFRYLNHFLETNKAQTVRQYDAIQRRYQGIPWVNSLAADSKGEAYFSMNGAIPNVPNDKAQRCQTALGLVTFGQLGLPTVDGSRSECEWGEAAGSADKGLLPNAKTPSLFRRDYVANGNDSHWLVNDKQPLEGFDRIVGIERAEITPRTRLGLTMIRDRLAGRDGLAGNRFSQENLKWIALGNRQYLGELWRSELVRICRTDALGPARGLRRAGRLVGPRRPGRSRRAAVPALRGPRLPRHRLAAQRHPGRHADRAAQLHHPVRPRPARGHALGPGRLGRRARAPGQRRPGPARRRPAAERHPAGRADRQAHGHPGVRRPRRPGRVQRDHLALERQGPGHHRPRHQLHPRHPVRERPLRREVQHVRDLRPVREPELAPPQRLHARLPRQEVEPDGLLRGRGAGRAAAGELRGQQLRAPRRADLRVGQGHPPRRAHRLPAGAQGAGVGAGLPRHAQAAAAGGVLLAREDLHDQARAPQARHLRGAAADQDRLRPRAPAPAGLPRARRAGSSGWPRSAATSSAASSSGWRWPGRCSRASGSGCATAPTARRA